MELRLAILQRQDGNKVAMETAQRPVTEVLIDEEAMRNGPAAMQICDSFWFCNCRDGGGHSKFR
jgi:hypothetical protein